MTKKFTRYYTGIGSRKTPDNILAEMRVIAKKMSQDLFVVRSGGAEGADTAFEIGAGANTEVYLPWDGFNGHKSKDGTHLDARVLYTYKKAQYIAAMHHPAWDKLSEGAKKLHTRNVYQVLGFDLETPSKCVMLWAEPIGTTVKGGTATAVSIAKEYRIPTFNFYFQQELDKVKDIIGL